MDREKKPLKRFENLIKRSAIINQYDFARALKSRDFEEMSNIYNEMKRYDNDSEEMYSFAEMLDGNVINLSLIANGKIKAIGMHFYYGLAEEYIYYALNRYPEDDDELDLVYDVFKNDFIECDKIVLTENHIELTPKAVKQLGLSIGDIIKLRIDEQSIIISKYE